MTTDKCRHGVLIATYCGDCDRDVTFGEPERGHVTPVGCWLLVALAVLAGMGLAVWGATR